MIIIIIMHLYNYVDRDICIDLILTVSIYREYLKVFQGIHSDIPNCKHEVVLALLHFLVAKHYSWASFRKRSRSETGLKKGF